MLANWRHGISVRLSCLSLVLEGSFCHSKGVITVIDVENFKNTLVIAIILIKSAMVMAVVMDGMW